MRLCEIYTSTQGEGPNTGKAITFVRFGGCNLRCPGWGTGTLPDGTEVPGCDTVFAVYPEWRDTWEQIGPDEVFDRIPSQPKHVCLTGGEPLTQRTKEMERLVAALTVNQFNIDLFTNGSQELPDWARQSHVTVVMDLKLPGSGEWGSFKADNLWRLQKKDAIKFVCKDRADFEEAIRIVRTNNFYAQRWYGPVWDELDPAELAEWVKEDDPVGYMNVQVHKYVWSPEERRV